MSPTESRMNNSTIKIESKDNLPCLPLKPTKVDVTSYLQETVVRMMVAMNKRDYSSLIWNCMDEEAFEAHYEDGQLLYGRKHLDTLQHLTLVEHPKCRGTILGQSVSVDMKNGTAEIFLGVETLDAPVGEPPVQHVGILGWERKGESGEWRWVKYLAMTGMAGPSMAGGGGLLLDSDFMKK